MSPGAKSQGPMQLRIPRDYFASAAVHDSNCDPNRIIVVGTPQVTQLCPATGQSALALSGFVSALLAIFGMVSSGFDSVVPVILVALSITLALTAICHAVVTWPRPENFDLDSSKRNLEEKIEQLEDLRWQARDNADHLQALLDGQSDIIIKRDAMGRVVFANRTFCNKFAVQLEDVLRRPFHPEIVARSPDATRTAARTADMPNWAQPSIEKIETVDGARWIEWSHRWLDDTQDSEAAVQSIGRDITEQRLHEKALATARDEARAADRAKSRFLASMSHEIRTPMNGILGMSGLLNETALTPEQRTYTQAVRKSAVTLLELIDEILDFSKIEAGHVDLASDPVDIIDCVQSAVELLAPRAYQKQLQLAWSMAPDMPRHVTGDETRLRQILLNLLGNAVKFTEEGGVSVWVGAEQADSGCHHIQIVIRDTGPGLSDEARARIFMEFERAVPNGALHESGTGLGLAIAQRLAQSMGGGINVASRLGAGATFTLSIRLPGADTPAPQAPEIRSLLERRHVMIISPRQIERRTIANFLRSYDVAVCEFSNLSELSDWTVPEAGTRPDTILLDLQIDPDVARRSLARIDMGPDLDTVVIGAAGDRDAFERFNAAGIEKFLVRPIRPTTLLALLAGQVERSTAPHSPTTAAPAQVAVARRILVAEDNEINALLARTVLTRLGCEALVVPNGREAIDAVARVLEGKSPPLDAILMDLHMPIINGLDATAEIRQLCETAGQPCPAIIAVTANAFREDRDRCLAAGMDDYLPKPFEPGDLRRVLEGLPVPLLAE